MGLFSFLSNMFNKNIDCDDIVYSYVVFRDTTKKVLYYNHNIVVNPEINAVVVCKNKVCDVLPVGKYKITSSSLPNTFKKINFEKHEKKYHAPIHKFKAEVYFVNMRERVSFKFSSDEPFFFKNTKFGKVFGFVDGECTLRVIDSEALCKALLYGEKTIDIMQVNENIGLWIGNEINKRLEKSKIRFEDMLLKHSLIDDYVNDTMSQAFDKLGFTIKDIKIKAFRTSQKTQDLINKFIASHKSLMRKVKLTNTKSSDVITVSLNRNKSATSNKNSSPVLNYGASSSTDVKRCKVCGNIVKGAVCTKCGAKIK
ncbi:MAG: SPFH domain-containing protein [Clostridia bacterium]|nr:SPFH domain-containing protein [Clostridia bacterium]